MAHQTAFQVSGFVAVDIPTLGQTIDHADHFRQKFFCLGLVFQIAQIFDSSTGRFLVITILQAALFGLADALECRTMVSHILQRMKLQVVENRWFSFWAGKGTMFSRKKKKRVELFYLFSDG